MVVNMFCRCISMLILISIIGMNISVRNRIIGMDISVIKL